MERSTHGNESEITHNVWWGQGLVSDMRLQFSSACIFRAILEAEEAAGNIREALEQFWERYL